MTVAHAGELGRRIAGALGPLTLEKVATVGIENARRNAPISRAGKSVLALRETAVGHGTDALVLAAGPSLHRQDVAAQIKAARFGGAIIATESAMAYCLRHGITPDLVVTLDPDSQRIVRWFGDPALDDAKLAADDYFSRQDMDPAFRRNQLAFNQELTALVDRHGPAMKIALSSSASREVVDRVAAAGMDVYWWNPMYDDYDQEPSLTREVHALNGLPCLNAGGNVGAASWVLAHAVLSKQRVAVAGMDFGYYADTTYQQTQYYRELLALVGADRLDEVFVRFVNPHTGTEFFTDPAYLWYRDAFLEMARDAECTTYNCTGGGILFGDPIKWRTLAEFFALAS